MSDNPKRIFLECGCVLKHDEGRQWCEDDVWVTCEECGGPSTEYTRADLAQARIAALEAALEPFAALANHYRQDGPDTLSVYDIQDDRIFTLGDLREARAVLEKAE